MLGAVLSMCICVCVSVSLWTPGCLCYACFFQRMRLHGRCAFVCLWKLVLFHSFLSIHEQMGAGVHHRFAARAGHYFSARRLNPHVVEAVSVASATTQSLSFTNSCSLLGGVDMGTEHGMRGDVKAGMKPGTVVNKPGLWGRLRSCCHAEY